MAVYDCVLPCSGGDAVVVTCERRAPTLGRRPIRILAGDERTNYRPRTLVMLEGGSGPQRGRLSAKRSRPTVASMSRSTTKLT